MADNFAGTQGDVTSPATRLFLITPHDSNELSEIPREVYVGGAGDITCRAMNSGVDVVLKAVPAGSRLPYRLRYIRATGTTATLIVGAA